MEKSKSLIPRIFIVLTYQYGTFYYTLPLSMDEMIQAMRMRANTLACVEMGLN